MGISVEASQSLRYAGFAVKSAPANVGSDFGLLVPGPATFGSEKYSVVGWWAKQAVPEATVLGASMREDQAIVLWLQFDGTAEPRAYALPWDIEDAKGLQEAMRRAEADGTSVRMRWPFAADSTRREPLFYAEPRPALPPKIDSAG